MDIDVNIEVLISEEELQKRIAELAAQISCDYEGKNLHIVSVLRGSVFITTALANKITVPLTMDFMSVGSYGSGTRSLGTVELKKDLEDSIEGKDVLIVEDIIDTGYTLSELIPMMKKRNPASVKVCTLLDKPDRRKVSVDVDYVGFQIPDEFVVGFGLDYDQKYRQLPYIGIVRE